MKNKFIIILLACLAIGCKPTKVIQVDKKTEVVHGKGNVTQLYSTVPKFKNAEANKLNNEALLLAQKGNFKAAKEGFQKARLLENDNSWIVANLGLAEMFLKNYDESITLLKEAIEMNPTNFSHYQNLAVVYEKNKQYKKAVETNLLILNSEVDTRTKGLVNISITEAYLSLNECNKAKEALKRGKTLIGERVYEIIDGLEELDKDVEKCSL